MTWTAPRTWVAGETVNEGHLNAHVRDNLLELDPTVGWTDFTLINGWVNYDAVNWEAAQYTKRAGIVYTKGLIKNGTATAGTVITTLPVGYRPSADLIFCSGSNGAFVRIDVQADGDILFRTNGSPSWASISFVFPADQ